MLDPAVFEYALNVFSVANMLAMLGGISVGLVIGAIPGLSPPMAIALLIPVSFGLPADTAIILMVSCYAAGIYGGSFTAILLRAPGTSASAASAIEGFELTKRGRAMEAIRISTFASVMGGFISGLALVLLAQPLAGVAFWFGPAEMFLIAILGLISIAAVASGYLLRGLLAGCFGLLLSTFGVDNYSGFPRFTFGYDGFASGIDILPAIVGLFAFAQGLELCRADASGSVSGRSRLSWNIFPRWSEIWHTRWSLVRGWTVGLVMGLIPAAGASVAQWVAYAWEIRQRKPGDRFGEGEIKGLAATEASNNGVTGTSLIPLFILGIPGGISAAVILGALTIHGLQPGMRLFRTSPEIVYTIMWGFVIANVLMGFVAAIMARTLAYLTLFPRGILGPLIIVFSIVGTYAGTRNYHDVYLMLAFGFIGYYAQLWKFSPAAILLGLILGPIAENGLRDLMVVSRDSPILYTLGRVQSLIIIGVILALIYYSWRPRSKAVQEAESGLDAGGAADRSAQ